MLRVDERYQSCLRESKVKPGRKIREKKKEKKKEKYPSLFISHFHPDRSAGTYLLVPAKLLLTPSMVHGSISTLFVKLSNHLSCITDIGILPYQYQRIPSDLTSIYYSPSSHLRTHLPTIPQLSFIPQAHSLAENISQTKHH